MVQHFIAQCLLYYLSSACLREDKTKENYNFLALKVVAVADEK